MAILLLNGDFLAFRRHMPLASYTSRCLIHAMGSRLRGNDVLRAVAMIP
jgi:hypothetical protein